MRKIVANVTGSFLENFDERGYHRRGWMPLIVKFPNGRPRSGHPCVIVIKKEPRWYKSHKELESIEKPKSCEGEKLVIRIYPIPEALAPAKFDLIYRTGETPPEDCEVILSQDNYHIGLKTPQSRVKAAIKKFQKSAMEESL